jgi:L-serine dehydratase
MDGRLRSVLVEFDPAGSLATTHKSQGSDMGLFGGLLGWEADDERLPDASARLEAAGIGVEIVITPIMASHPNTYKLIMDDGDEVHTLTAISTGGGMIEVIRIDGAEVSMAGDYYETLIFCSSPGGIPAYLGKVFPFEELIWHDAETPFLEMRSRTDPGDEVCGMLPALADVRAVRRLSPVLPVLSSKTMRVPVLTCGEMPAWASSGGPGTTTVEGQPGKQLWELAVDYECARGGTTLGGLSITRTAKALEEKLENRQVFKSC